MTFRIEGMLRIKIRQHTIQSVSVGIVNKKLLLGSHQNMPLAVLHQLVNIFVFMIEWNTLKIILIGVNADTVYGCYPHPAFRVK